MLNLYLDDKRKTPNGWIRFYTPKEIIKFLEINFDSVDEISLDHDLGDDYNIGTGYDVLLWIEKYCHLNKPPKIPILTVHSSNPKAKNKMLNVINSINIKAS